MTSVWNRSQQAWNLPDAPDKGDDAKQNIAALDLASAENSAAPTFDVDFTPREGQPSEYVPGSTSESGFVMQQPAAEDDSQSLEIGQPGDFLSQMHDHAVRLQQNFPQSSEPQKQEATFVMVDEPMPEAFSSNAAVQDMFVAEVLKGAQALSSANSGSFGQTFELTRAAGVFDSDKKINGPETSTSLTANQSDSPLPTLVESAVSTLPSAAPSAPLPPASPPLLARPTTEAVPAPSAPKPASIPKQDADKASPADKSKAGSEDKSKAGSAAKPSAAAKEKTTAASKDKAPAGDKKAGAAQKAADAKQTKTNMLPAQDKNLEKKSFIPAVVKGASKEARMVMAVFVLAMFVWAAALFKQMTRTQVTSQMSSEIAQKSAEPKASIEKKARVKNPETKAPAKADPKLAIENTNRKVPGESNSFDDDFADDEIVLADHILTRPTSRYAEANSPLALLADISLALDRVEPRKVVVLLKSMPQNFGSAGMSEKNAIRDLTGRYYLQVAAYPKAIILFRQACSDPGKTSDLEICLNAARAYLLAGFQEEANEVVNSLNTRLIGQKSQWREWIKILDAGKELFKPTSENLTRFTDEMIDKGPFLTSEWNLQMSIHFARMFMTASEPIKLEFLKSVTGVRKKSLEVRLAPGQYGPDIGSYMFPSFLNIMLRNYELPQLIVQSDDPETDSEISLTAWMFNVVAQAKPNEPRETRARLAPLFAERSFSPLARLIEGHLAAQAGDFLGAHAMIIEQIGQRLSERELAAERNKAAATTRQFLTATQRLQDFPFLYVEWLYLAVKVASGLGDKENMESYSMALEDVRRRYPELVNEYQYWSILGRAKRLLGDVAGVAAAAKEAGRLATTHNELGFVAADRVWLLMKKGQRVEARTLLRQSNRDIPHHSRLLEIGVEFAAQWGEDPSTYLRMEAEIPKKFENRGRDSVLLSPFTLRKLLNHF
ncbi:hypothetical protein EBU99_10375 [bacterium]|nr:hypothetical protein [bacterium]